MISFSAANRTTRELPPRSTLGPLLWIIMYNGVLTLDLPNGGAYIGFAGDIEVMVVARLLLMRMK